MSFQGFVQRFAAKHLDKGVKYTRQSDAAIRRLCVTMRTEFRLCLSTKMTGTQRPSWRGICTVSRDAATRKLRARQRRHVSNVPGDKIRPRLGLESMAATSHPLSDSWFDHVSYLAQSGDNPLTVRPDLGQFQNYVSLTAVERLEAVVQRSAWSSLDDVGVTPQLAEVRISVDFNGLVEDVVASVIRCTPGNVDLVLGFDWIQKHSGSYDWTHGRFRFEGGGAVFYLDSLANTRVP
ncbi:hypothetical protein AURDEDRAFT_178108 [Auricularia subglabra TFB-10046 SS5]|uniref:Uncharacterized protein n=1 Tax=Auricularia subglabra (strain TFB-10046 / SS5) TaxID=717982 RepID=J0WLX4_AURST|nr:hypothetical protein AURDEDRAFT_178108 [Auricularia subglabra TFB-10046 SS5]